MKVKFTKGDWSYVFEDSSVYGGSELICETYSTGDDELEANAHLIAAAPLMYKALERVKQGHLNLCELNIVPDRYQKDVYKIVDEINELLKRARGEHV